MKKEINKKTRCSGCEGDDLLSSEYYTHNTPMSFNNMKYNSDKNRMQFFSGCGWRDDSRCLSLFNAAVESGDPLVISASDSKGNEVTMLTKITGYTFECGVVTAKLSRKGLMANNDDTEVSRILREFKSGNYKNLVIRALHLLARGSLYSYSIPEFKGVMKKGMDGGFRLAFKDVDKKALQYDNRTGVVSSMDASDFIEFLARRKHEYIAHLLLKDSGKRFKFKLGELKGVKKADGGWTLLTDVLEVDGGCQVLDAFLEG